jgi:hypothetical protein
MRRSLLLASIVALSAPSLFAQDKQALPEPMAHPQSKVAPSATRQTGAGVSTSGKHKKATPKKGRTITHYSADQHKLDSIKAEKNKMKR